MSRNFDYDFRTITMGSSVPADSLCPYYVSTGISILACYSARSPVTHSFRAHLALLLVFVLLLASPFARAQNARVRWAHKEQELRVCHILFISHSESRRYEKIFKAIEGESVLTVGETPDFLASGGTIDFLIENDRLQFEVSMAAAEDAHLRISSNMLALARHVVVRAQAAKSSKITMPALRTLFATPLLHGDGTL